MLSELAHEGVRLQPERGGWVRCSACSLGGIMLSIGDGGWLLYLATILTVVDNFREEYASDFYNQKCKREDKQGNRKTQKTLRKFNEFLVRAIGALSDRAQ